MLEYTGHPLVDVGIATITAFVGKSSPTELKEADLDSIAEYMERNYTVDPLKRFLTVAFPNSGFTQPAYNRQPEKRDLYAKRILYAYRSDAPTSSEVGVFTGKPAVGLSLDVKDVLPPGHTYRQHIPLVTGEGVINFHPGGYAGLPVSGVALLAIHALPLGSAKCGGRLLAVHSDNDEITHHFARVFLEKNRQALQLVQAQGGTKLPESERSYRTLLIETLLEAESMRGAAYRDDQPFSVTAYHLTNSGQGADIAIYTLPMQVVGFLRCMMRAEHHSEWNTVVQRAWQRPKVTAKGPNGADESFVPRFNSLYEALFRLPDEAKRFVRRYFLRIPALAESLEAEEEGSQRGRSWTSWGITAEFLRRVMQMEQARIEEIRTLGDRIAQYVQEQNDRRFFGTFMQETKYWRFRLALIRASLNEVKRGKPPLVSLDPFIAVFEEGDELARSDWGFARDLVLIRVIERLYEAKWLQANEDALNQIVQTEEQEAEREVV